MSADTGRAAASPAAVVPAAAGRPDGSRPAPHGHVSSWLRFYRSELRLVFRRPRNLALLAALAAVPVFLGIVFRLTLHGAGGQGPPFLNQLTTGGVFLALVVLSFALSVLLLPLVVAVVAGDAIAGEAGYGTLRGLLAVPAGRTRLLAVKCAAIGMFSLAVCLLLAAVSLITGLLLFRAGPVTLLSGTTVPLWSGVLRVLMVAVYAAAAMFSLGVIGLAASALTQHPVGAIAGLLVLVVASEICDQVPQLAAIHAYLPTHFWLSFAGLFRAPADWSGMLRGLVSFGGYAVVFGSIAWARLTSADVTS